MPDATPDLECHFENVRPGDTITVKLPQTGTTVTMLVVEQEVITAANVVSSETAYKFTDSQFGIDTRGGWVITAHVPGNADDEDAHE